MNKDNLFWGVVFLRAAIYILMQECWDGTGC